MELGADVECNISTGNNRGGAGGCTAAESVRLLEKGSIPRPNINAEVLDGTVIRPLRSANPDQVEYAGLIKVNPTTEDEETPEYEFGIMGLVNKRELLQTGDPVQFQVDSDNHATNIVAVRKKRRATVDAVKGPFGFLAYEVDEGKKLFFHMSEVCDDAKLKPGDQVEFVLVTNQRSGKSSACNVVRLRYIFKILIYTYFENFRVNITSKESFLFLQWGSDTTARTINQSAAHRFFRRLWTEVNRSQTAQRSGRDSRL